MAAAIRLTRVRHPTAATPTELTLFGPGSADRGLRADSRTAGPHRSGMQAGPRQQLVASKRPRCSSYLPPEPAASTNRRTTPPRAQADPRSTPIANRLRRCSKDPHRQRTPANGSCWSSGRFATSTSSAKAPVVLEWICRRTGSVHRGHGLSNSPPGPGGGDRRVALRRTSVRERWPHRPRSRRR